MKIGSLPRFLLLVACGVIFVLAVVSRAGGVEPTDLDPRSRAFYDYALEQAQTMTGGSAEGFVLRRLRVTKIRGMAADDAACRRPQVACDLRAKVVGYTVLGIPYTDFEVTCCEVHRRLLW